MPRTPKPKERGRADYASRTPYLDRKRNRYRLRVDLDGYDRPIWVHGKDAAECNRKRADLLSGRTVPRQRAVKLADVEVEPVKLAGYGSTVGTAAAYWRDHVLPNMALAPATEDQYRWAIDVIVGSALGAIALDDLTTPIVQGWLDDLAPRLGQNSLRIVRGRLCQILDELVDDGRLPRNAARRARVPATATAQVERHAYSADESDRYVAACEHSEYGYLYLLALYTGARPGELLGLSWDAVDLDAATARIEQQQRRRRGGGYEIVPILKTDASARTIRLSVDAVAALGARQIEQQVDQSNAGRRWLNTPNLVFTTSIGSQLDRTRVNRKFRELRVAAELPVDGVVLYSSRHTAVSRAIDDGNRLDEVADYHGHSVAEMLRTYRHRLTEVVELSEHNR